MNGKVKLILKKGIHSLSPSSSLLDQKSADFSIKGQIVNIFGSADQLVSITTTLQGLYYLYSSKATTDNIHRNGCGYVSVKLYL